MLPSRAAPGIRSKEHSVPVDPTTCQGNKILTALQAPPKASPRVGTRESDSNSAFHKSSAGVETGLGHHFH
jgi:hypothetical protein